ILKKSDLRVWPQKSTNPPARPFSSFDVNERDLSGAALRQHEPAVRCWHHIAHHATARRNGPGLEFFRPRVESHECVWAYPRLAVPDDIIEHSDPVGLRFGTRGRRPFMRCTGFRI